MIWAALKSLESASQQCEQLRQLLSMEKQSKEVIWLVSAKYLPYMGKVWLDDWLKLPLFEERILPS